MKCSVLITNNIRQIMLEPENKTEEAILNLIRIDDTVTVESAGGSFSDEPITKGYKIAECQGGYLRAYSYTNCLMLVVKPKEKP